MERIFISQFDNELFVESCQILLPELFLENWWNWIIQNFEEAVSGIFRSNVFDTIQGKDRKIDLRAVVRQMPVHINSLAAIAKIFRKIRNGMECITNSFPGKV